MDDLHIPPFVNYDCQCCGWCCRQYDITFSRADHERLSKYDWASLEPALAGKEWCEPLRDRSTPDTYRFRYTPDGACVFLSPDDMCLMHRHVGELGKALPCCVYPFTFAGTPRGVYVGCRFSCRAVAYGLGEPIVRRADFIEKQLLLCESAHQVPRYRNEVDFDGRTTIAWDDYLALESALVRGFLRDDLPFVRRLFFAHKLADVLREVKMERVRGRKFKELVRILERGLLAEARSESLPAGVGVLARVMFRQFCFLFQRRQGGSYREMSVGERLRERLRQFWRGVVVTLGKGALEPPAFPGRLDLSRLEATAVGELGHEEEMALSRYMAAKVFGKQYFGKLFFGYPVLQGLNFLILAAGAVMWYARARAAARGSDEVSTEDVIEAIRYVDFCYGYSSAPGLVMERVRVRLLSQGDTAARVVLSQYGC